MSTREFTEEQARAVGQRIGIDWAAGDVDLEQFRMGLAIELEHGTQDPTTNVTDDDETITGKIALAHLREIRDVATESGSGVPLVRGRRGHGGEDPRQRGTGAPHERAGVAAGRQSVVRGSQSRHPVGRTTI